MVLRQITATRQCQMVVEIPQISVNNAYLMPLDVRAMDVSVVGDVPVVIKGFLTSIKTARWRRFFINRRHKPPRTKLSTKCLTFGIKSVVFA